MSTRARGRGAYPAPALGRLWMEGLVHPRRAMRALRDVRGIRPGLCAVLTRWVVTDAAVTIPQALLHRTPFTPARLPVPAERYYRVQSFLLPVIGTGVWLLMGAAGHSALRLAGQDSRLDAVLNVVGLGMLVPMPPLWAGDVVMVATDRFRLPDAAITHGAVELWEALLFAAGLRAVLDVEPAPALAVGLALGGLYIAVASPIVR